MSDRLVYLPDNATHADGVIDTFDSDTGTTGGITWPPNIQWNCASTQHDFAVLDHGPSRKNPTRQARLFCQKCGTVKVVE